MIRKPFYIGAGATLLAGVIFVAGYLTGARYNAPSANTAERPAAPAASPSSPVQTKPKLRANANSNPEKSATPKAKKSHAPAKEPYRFPKKRHLRRKLIRRCWRYSAFSLKQVRQSS
jgi:hypothetical protein